MSKTILTQVDGFTPLPDLLVTRYGIMTAAVWGKMWRYCQGKDGVCRAKLERIAEELNVSRMTIIRHIETLVADGFMKDTTPNLKNKPHIYADTGKVAMYNKFGMSVTVTESYTKENGVTQSDSAVTESDSQSHLKLLEDSIEDRNEDSSTTAGKIFQLYEQNIGLIHNVALSQEIGEYADLPGEWLEYAFKQAADANARNWRYVRAVLENCKSKNGIPQKEEQRNPKTDFTQRLPEIL